MAIGVTGIDLPGCIAVRDRNRSAVIVRNAVAENADNRSELRVRRGRRKIAKRRGAVCVEPCILYRLVYPVVPFVRDGQRRILSESLLNLQAPFLILGNMRKRIGIV